MDFIGIKKLPEELRGTIRQVLENHLDLQYIKTLNGYFAPAKSGAKRAKLAGQADDDLLLPRTDLKSDLSTQTI